MAKRTKKITRQPAPSNLWRVYEDYALENKDGRQTIIGTGSMFAFKYRELGNLQKQQALLNDFIEIYSENDFLAFVQHWGLPVSTLGEKVDYSYMQALVRSMRAAVSLCHLIKNKDVAELAKWISSTKINKGDISKDVLSDYMNLFSLSDETDFKKYIAQLKQEYGVSGDIKIYTKWRKRLNIKKVVLSEAERFLYKVIMDLQQKRNIGTYYARVSPPNVFDGFFTAININSTMSLKPSERDYIEDSNTLPEQYMQGIYINEQWIKSPLIVAKEFMRQYLENILVGIQPGLIWELGPDNTWDITQAARIFTPWQAMGLAIYHQLEGGSVIRFCKNPKCRAILKGNRKQKYCKETKDACRMAYNRSRGKQL